jgi:flagellar motor switch protein FliM
VQIQSYRFGDAERVQYGSYPLLDTVMYRWARALEDVLFDELRTEVYAGSSTVEDMRFAAFHSSLKYARPIYRFELRPFSGLGMLVLDNRFANLCLGGTAQSRGDAAGIQLTQQNHRRMQAVVQRMMTEYDRCWAGVHSVQSSLRKITTYLFRARYLHPYESCLVAQVHLSGRHISSRLMILLPRLMLEPIWPRISEQRIIPPLGGNAVVVSGAATAVADAPYRLEVRMGHIRTSLAADTLHVGSVFALESDSGPDAVLELNGKPVLVGTVGTVEDRYAIQVTGQYVAQRASAVKPPELFQAVQWPVADRS